MLAPSQLLFTSLSVPAKKRQLLDAALERVIAVAHDDVDVPGIAIDKRGTQRRQIRGGRILVLAGQP
jgi:hypothetical protein